MAKYTDQGLEYRVLGTVKNGMKVIAEIKMKFGVIGIGLG